jgi:hypothetical protein
VIVLAPACFKLVPIGVGDPETDVETTFVFQFMLMLVSLYGLKTTAPAFPVGPPELLPAPLLDPLPELLPLPEPLLLEELEPLLLPVPPGHVAPPGSHPVPQLTVWQW